MLRDFLGRHLRAPMTPAPRAAPPTGFPDRFVAIGSGTSDGAGRAVVTLVGPPRRERWLIEFASIDSPAGTAELYRNAELPSNLLAVAPASPNALDRDHPAVIFQGERIVAVFAGAGAGVVCTIRVEGRRVRVG